MNYNLSYQLRYSPRGGALMDKIPGLTLPGLQGAKRILAIQPHYDDNDISAGGTLLQLSERGVEINYLTVTDDLAGVSHSTWSQSEASQHLEEEQQTAGKMLGVQRQIRLDYPDAGYYDYFDLRDKIIYHIHDIKPDFIFTVDSWTPYEAHNDHIQTGKAVSEAAILYQTRESVEANHARSDYKLQGIVFYNTAYPNLIYDISPVIEKKQRLLQTYMAQFTSDGMKELLEQITFLAAYVARDQPFEFGEALKIVAPWMLHGVPQTMYL